MSDHEPDLDPESNPFLKAIVAETRRLDPKTYVVAGGHVGDVLGAPVHTPEGEARLLRFAELAGLDVGHDGHDGLVFRVVTASPEPPVA